MTKLFRRLMELAIQRGNYGYAGALDTIDVAISSHNRDGAYADYRKIIVMQLEYLDTIGGIEKARRDPDFRPLLQIASDFTWHSNYGFRAAIAGPECYIDLAELFVSWGFDNLEHRDPKTDHSPLTRAIERGHHPGITAYITWLLERGADMRENDRPEVNARAIAIAKGHTEIVQRLDQYGSRRQADD